MRRGSGCCSSRPEYCTLPSKSLIQPQTTHVVSPAFIWGRVVPLSESRPPAEGHQLDFKSVVYQTDLRCRYRDGKVGPARCADIQSGRPPSNSGGRVGSAPSCRLLVRPFRSTPCRSSWSAHRRPTRLLPRKAKERASCACDLRSLEGDEQSKRCIS
jgi:hypothetical protein